VEITYLQDNAFSYGWKAVLYNRLEAKAVWSKVDEAEHITSKELKAVRLAVQTFLPNLAGRNILLHKLRKPSSASHLY
jgi:hypothetical protein